MQNLFISATLNDGTSYIAYHEVGDKFDPEKLFKSSGNELKGWMLTDSDLKITRSEGDTISITKTNDGYVIGAECDEPHIYKMAKLNQTREEEEARERRANAVLQPDVILF